MYILQFWIPISSGSGPNLLMECLLVLQKLNPACSFSTVTQGVKGLAGTALGMAGGKYFAAAAMMMIMITASKQGY